MTDIIKYDMTDIWASAGDVVAPDSAKIKSGWGVEVVPRQWWNWFENRQDQNIAYVLQKGLPEWDSTTEYIINKSYVQRNGIVYKATATSTNSDPTALTSWVRAFADYSASSGALNGVTPAANTMPYFTSASAAAVTSLTPFARTILDDTSAVAVRTTIGAQASHSNLTALSGVTADVNALPYFTSSTAMGVSTLTSFGRSLIGTADAAATRTLLGLTTAATTQLIASQVDGSIGRILTVGAFGVGRYTDLRDTIFVTGAPKDLYSKGFVTGLALSNSLGIVTNPIASFGTLQIWSSWNNASAITAINRVFIGPLGKTYTQTAVDADTWGPWVESWTTGNLVKTASNTDSTAGRMLKVGDFGVGSITSTTPSIATFYAHTASGLYQSISAATTSLTFDFVRNEYSTQSVSDVTQSLVTAPGAPDSVGGVQRILSVEVIGANGVTFYKCTDTAGGVFSAFYNGTNLSPWTVGITTGNVSKAIKDLGLNASATSPVTGSGNSVMSDSPQLTGTPTAPTAALGTSSTQIATTAFVASALTNPTIAGKISVNSAEMIVSGSTAGYTDYHAVGGSSDYDARIMATSTTSSTVNGMGTLTLSADTVVASSKLKCSALFTAPNATITTLNATSISTANFAVSGDFSPTNVNTPGSVTATGNLNASSVIATGGYIYAKASSGADNAVLTFQDSTGQTTGSIFTVGSSKNVRIYAGTTQAAVFDTDGYTHVSALFATSVNSTGNITVSAGSIDAIGTGTQRITSSKSGSLLNSSLYDTVGFKALTTDGTPPGISFHRQGDYAIALYMSTSNTLMTMDSSGVNREVLTNGTLGGWMADVNKNGAVGSIAFCRLGISTATYGQQVAGSDLQFGSTGAAGGQPTGTWVCLGWANGGNHTVFGRIA